MQALSKLPDLPNWLLYAGLGLAALYVYGSWPYRYWRRRGVPGPRMLPLFGDLFSFFRLGFRRMLLEYPRQYGKVYGTYILRRPALVVGDAEMVKQICVKKADCFVNRGSLGNETKPFDKGILVLKDQEWRRVRNLLTPSFSTGKLKAMHPLIQQCADQLCRSLLSAERQPLDVKVFCSNFTMDVVATTLFGLKINTQEQPNHDFKKHADKLFNPSLRSWKIWFLFLFPGIATKLFKKFEITLFPKESLDFFQNIISDALHAREASEDADKYGDFLASMVTARREAERQGAKGLTEHEVMAQSLTFFLAGFETTANALHYVMYFLATNPGCQQKAFEEASAVSSRHGGITYEAAKELRYLNWCFDEALRLCPPALLTNRVCNETTTVNGYEIEKGTVVHIPIAFLAQDPDVWERADEYLPERFEDSGGSAGGEEAAHLLPFGLGPRNCIGMRLAQLEVRVAMAMVLLRMRLLPADSTPTYEQLEFKSAGILMPTKPILLNVEPRD